jgi:hypothetical protein
MGVTGEPHQLIRLFCLYPYIPTLLFSYARLVASNFESQGLSDLSKGSKRGALIFLR